MQIRGIAIPDLFYLQTINSEYFCEHTTVDFFVPDHSACIIITGILPVFGHHITSRDL